MDDREEKIKRLKEARSKYSDLTRLKLNKTTSSREFSLGQVRKVENNFKPLQENYKKILENKPECTTPVSQRFSLRPKQSIIAMKVTSTVPSKGKIENIENVTVTDAGKKRAMELLETVARRNNLSSDVKSSPTKCLNSNCKEQLLLNNVEKETKENVRNFSVIEEKVVADEVTDTIKKAKSSRRVCFADDSTTLTYNYNETLTEDFVCETPISSKFSRQPRQSIFGVKQQKSTNLPSTTRSIDSIPVTEEGRKKAMEHLYRLIETSCSRNRTNV
uniref:Uncharacterized protein n=1 Tax=Strongyloides papillosus TaxID=174720 RepID=A0A0N5BAA5_STREA